MGDRFRSQPVTHGDVVRVVRATGHLEALTTVLVGAEISGRIGTVEADFNDQVEVGQVFGVVPARKAARLNPLAALRFE